MAKVIVTRGIEESSQTTVLMEAEWRFLVDRALRFGMAPTYA